MYQVWARGLACPPRFSSVEVAAGVVEVDAVERGLESVTEATPIPLSLSALHDPGHRTAPFSGGRARRTSPSAETSTTPARRDDPRGLGAAAVLELER